MTPKEHPGPIAKSRKKLKRTNTISNRNVKARVKKTKGKKISSVSWLRRQLNDPYVAKAKKLGYRSRSAFKLLEIDDRFNFLNPGKRVIDLGAAPGGWTQVAVERVKSLDKYKNTRGQVISIDLQEIEAIPGANTITLDFLENSSPEIIKTLLDGPPDIILSDMAGMTTGHAATDNIRIMVLLEIAVQFAQNVLAPGGMFLGKILKGGTETTLLNSIKRDFTSIKHVKPPASRADSRESFIIALGFRGKNHSKP